MWNFGGGLILKSNSDEKTLKKDIENTHKQKENKQSNNSKTNEINSIKLIKEEQIQAIIKKINKNDFTKSNVNEDEKILIAQHWIDIVPKVTNINFFQQMLSTQNFWEITKEKICIGNVDSVLTSFGDTITIPVLIDDLSPYTQYILNILGDESSKNFTIKFKENESANLTSETISSRNELISKKEQKHLIAKKILENFEKTAETLKSLDVKPTTIANDKIVFMLNTISSCQKKS